MSVESPFFKGVLSFSSSCCFTHLLSTLEPSSLPRPIVSLLAEHDHALATSPSDASCRPIELCNPVREVLLTINNRMDVRKDLLLSNQSSAKKLYNIPHLFDLYSFECYSRCLFVVVCFLRGLDRARVAREDDAQKEYLVCLRNRQSRTG